MDQTKKKSLLFFAGKIVGLYFLLNVIYLFWLHFLGNQVDAITYFVAISSQKVIVYFTPNVIFQEAVNSPKILFFFLGRNIITVSEGCNGASVLITFISSIFAFNGNFNSKICFSIFAALLVLVLNIIRVAVLFNVALYHHDWFAFLHEFAFTAIIYAVIFVLFIFWINKYGELNFGQQG
ncbi:MAG: exosortase family protein XrtF [Bacteroidetes bacterium]|nr:exosortase family protein XrtF [Bacteroidota bacterium]